ncbi:MAG: hypothetical protein GWN94_18705 [Phycisphaerae bacterium]|nr:hypothetical protein [Phycisphaerae bacterium]
MTEHTPGPWEYVYDVSYTGMPDLPEPDYEYGRISSKLRWSIATIYPDAEEWHANMRLIAAAPDLLDACEQAVLHIQAGILNAHDMSDILHAAIAKAKGEL